MRIDQKAISESQAPAPQPHVPVLLPEVTKMLAPKDKEVFIDCTFGAGGYTEAILKTARTRVYAIDKDHAAIKKGRHLEEEYKDRLLLVHGAFGELSEHMAGLGVEKADGVVLDLGVSSMQLDTPERGFSFRHDAPLDMRMGSSGTSAADVVNGFSEADLASVLFIYGEERRSRAIAKAIVVERAKQPITTTTALAGLVSQIIGHKQQGKIHPATRSFQALRIFINQELEELFKALESAERILMPGGRLVVVSFHSLEDRIVKRFMKEKCAKASQASRHQPESPVELPTFEPLTPKAITPSPGEIARNPRARSARLRAVRRLAGKGRRLAPSDVGLPNPRLEASFGGGS